MINDRRWVGFKNQDHNLLIQDQELTVEPIQRQQEESVLNNELITLDSYEEYDNDVHDIDDAESITEQLDDLFLNEDKIEIEDLVEYVARSTEETDIPTYCSGTRSEMRAQGEKAVEPDYALMLILAMKRAMFV